MAKMKLFIYSSASRSGNIFLHDHRASDKIIKYIGHHPDACNLKLSKNMHFLASGGDDGNVIIWDLVGGGQYQKIKAHKASSKASKYYLLSNIVIVTVQ